MKELEHGCDIRDEYELSRALREASQYDGLIDMNGLEVSRAKTVLMDIKLCRNIKKSSDLHSPEMRKAKLLLRDIRNKERHITTQLLEKEELKKPLKNLKKIFWEKFQLVQMLENMEITENQLSRLILKMKFLKFI